MSEEVRHVYRVQDGYVRAESGSWLPGLFHTPEAAWASFDCDDSAIVLLCDTLRRPITTADLAEAREALTRQEGPE